MENEIKERRENNSMVYCERVKLLRTKGKYTQQQFAEMLDVSTQVVTGIENGNKNLSLDVALKLNKLFHVSLDWLYGLNNKTGDKASDILFNIKSVFDINLADKSILIDKYLATLIEKMHKAYETRKELNLTDEVFTYMLECIKKEYNDIVEETKDEPREYIQYYFQTFEEKLIDIMSPKKSDRDN